MEKFCIFCGKIPEGKTKEHVLPQWLIELTGDPKRKVILSIIKGKRYSYSSFSFPSCEKCNQEFSDFEDENRVIVTKMLNSEKISAAELNLLFNWLDKVRVGLWLAYFYLHGNVAGINPNYHIKKRIGLYDRVLVICKTTDEIRGLSAIGCETLSFFYTPSCFSLHINNLLFLNISYNFLFSRRVGFPYPEESYWIDVDKLATNFASGKERVIYPLLKQPIWLKGTEIYQPMFSPASLGGKSMADFDTPYVRSLSSNWSQGVGKVLIEEDKKYNPYPSGLSHSWLPHYRYNFEEIFYDCQLQTLDSQHYIDSLAPSTLLLTSEVRKRMARKRNICERYYKEAVKSIAKQKRDDLEGERARSPKVL